MAPNPALKMAIFNSGSTQTVIARKAVISEARLSRIIHGHIDAEPEEKRALARILKQPIHLLFPEVAA
jgi:hypothetical protein